MSSKKGGGATAAAAAAASTAPAPTLPSGPGASRGSMTANGSVSAMQFLSARWRAVDVAANDTSIAVTDKPEIHNEKMPTASAAASPAPNSQTKTGSGQAKSGGAGAWSRRQH